MIGLDDCAVVGFEGCDCVVVDMLYKARMRIPFGVGAFILPSEVDRRIGELCGVEGSREGIDYVS